MHRLGTGILWMKVWFLLQRARKEVIEGKRGIQGLSNAQLPPAVAKEVGIWGFDEEDRHGLLPAQGAICAFAIELLLKGIIEKTPRSKAERQQIRRKGHNLVYLFDKIPTDYRKTAQAEYQARLDLIDMEPLRGEGLIKPKMSLRDILVAHRKDFDEYRYLEKQGEIEFPDLLEMTCACFAIERVAALAPVESVHGYDRTKWLLSEAESPRKEELECIAKAEISLIFGKPRTVTI